jgi:hypothetical protein
MACMFLVLAPVTQSGSSVVRLGDTCNAGRAARMDHRDIQQGGTVGLGKGHFNVGPRPLTANSNIANGCITGVVHVRARITARTGGDAADGFLPVLMSRQAASAQAIAAQGVVDVAALDVTPTKASGGGDTRVSASSAEAEEAFVDEVSVGEAELQVDRDGVQCSGKPQRACMED